MKKIRDIGRLVYSIMVLSGVALFGIISNGVVKDEASMYDPKDSSKYEEVLKDYNNYNFIPYYLVVKDKFFKSYE